MFKKLISKWLRKYDTTMSFKEGMALTELPIVTLYQGEKSFNFLLDTGSNDNVLDKAALKKIKHLPSSGIHRLYGIDGNVKEVQVYTISLSYKGRDFVYDYLVHDLSVAFKQIKDETGVTLHGMLGSKFFNKYKYVLDFDELVAYSKK